MTDQQFIQAYSGPNSLRAANAGLVLQRGAQASTSTGIQLKSASGAAVSQAILLNPGSDDLIFGADNGTSFTEYLRIKAAAAQGLRFSSTTTAPPSTAANTFSGGLRLSLFGTGDTNDANSYGIGIDASTMWFNTAAAAGFFKFYVAGSQVAYFDQYGNLSLNGSPVFCLDWGTFTHTYGGGQDNVNNIAMNRNFHARSGVVVHVFTFEGNHGPKDYLVMNVNTSVNPATFNFQMNDGNAGTSYVFGWIALG